MQSEKLLTLINGSNRITINELTLGDTHYYFWFNGEFDHDLPKRGKGSLYPCFEALWDAFPFDPFQCTPEIEAPLPGHIREFLSNNLAIKNAIDMKEVLHMDAWESCLSALVAIPEAHI
ncbi:hypothetical protein [Robertkochia sediminum]|uniref:hypothetical protein n=1 Tax=Robertkochia sediminum TaxID=2785326 RepID=UPI0019335CF0|nr:hypothetical protein [Robertkochia sediminum]MBL7471408.1 hypothetical protein [Robertkochia sediminum]